MVVKSLRHCKLCLGEMDRPRSGMGPDVKFCSVCYKERVRKQQATWQKNNPKSVAYNLYNQAKGRAKKKGLPFTIALTDIIIPEFCPILGVRLKHGVRFLSPTSPTLDRVHSSRGYEVGNVRVISFRANNIKSDGTAAEHRQVAEYIEAHQ